MKRINGFLLATALLLVAGVATAQSACFTAKTNDPLTATVSWIAPTTNTDGSAVTVPLTYNVYQGTSATALVKTLTGLTSLSTSISTGFLRGGTYYFAVSATGGSVEGAQSNVACKFFPSPTPGTVTGTAVT